MCDCNLIGEYRRDIYTGSDAYLHFWELQDARRGTIHPAAIPLENRADGIIFWRGIVIQTLSRALTHIRNIRSMYLYTDDDVCIGYADMNCAVKFYELYFKHHVMVHEIIDCILLDQIAKSTDLKFSGKNIKCNVSSKQEVTNSNTEAKVMQPKISALLKRMLLETGMQHFSGYTNTNNLICLTVLIATTNP